jgi:hypothetical protein
MRRTPKMLVSLCVLAALANPSPAFAATAWDLVSPRGFDPHARADRVAVAHDLQSRVDRLADLVRVQSAAEVQQLDRDEAKLRATENAPALANLQLSVAYQHRKLANLLAEISAALECVITSDDEPEEMHCWAMTSWLLSDQEAFRLALSTLRDQRRVPLNKNLPPLLRGPEIWYDTYARGILEIILIPYLKDAARPSYPPPPSYTPDPPG